MSEEKILDPLSQEAIDYVKDSMRIVPDFPKPGIQFVDITTSVKDPKALQLSIDFLRDTFKDQKIDYIAGIEARGFGYGTGLAYALGVGFLCLRKPNKLPGEKISESYGLEYGKDTIEMHTGALKPGDRVVIIDDLLATGGTAEAAVKLLKRCGAEIVASAFIVELAPLKGRQRLESIGSPVVTMFNYDFD